MFKIGSSFEFCGKTWTITGFDRHYVYATNKDGIRTQVELSFMAKYGV